ncbi:Small nuclear ribonucleoprotein-associated protein [Wickerhamomyces ciferrii]|uniref:Small nuclear ribonucleoprotein-associated protein n=1 Tax=Wickerhamomyces ciferrii (strain ATCC 14091 / BCRC 22168 / CBS 111 / JCM 3599 / NBRC 0793 / NRRL Y-1031 F-60-10) TaxID=1206466 RepID=K0KM69_WICCF|nr:Small nuclear ribonucleoprotein-associated protein [Wickerhamomyces ciferrii]CCH46345.1 Small nuclear ribonucleoprotein-associated protein [Wickerhamomyces ciferrii]
MTSIEDLIPSDLIGTELKVTIKDQRILIGILLALDNKPNLLLNNVIEISNQYNSIIGSESENKRELGLVSIPFDSIENIKIKNIDLDKTLDWKDKSLN